MAMRPAPRGGSVVLLAVALLALFAAPAWLAALAAVAMFALVPLRDGSGGASRSVTARTSAFYPDDMCRSTSGIGLLFAIAPRAA